MSRVGIRWKVFFIVSRFSKVSMSIFPVRAAEIGIGLLTVIGIEFRTPVAAWRSLNAALSRLLSRRLLTRSVLD